MMPKIVVTTNASAIIKTKSLINGPVRLPPAFNWCDV